MPTIDFLKQVLSIPTVTYREDLMVDFISKWLKENDIEHYIDTHRNIYATKSITKDLPEDFYYPCVVSHTDTVHKLDTINIFEDYLPNAQDVLKPSLFAKNDHGQPTGIGGDDKCGVFACLTLLKELPYLKAAFFVSEETGCNGSRQADPNFFENVGYAIQFDAPENWMITETCYSQQLFDKDSEFFKVCDSVLSENMNKNDMRYMTHPYTDVWALRGKFDFSCINFSIGYYNYHTKNEYVVIEDVYNGIKMGREMIQKLGYTYHFKKPNTQKSQNYLWD